MAYEPPISKLTINCLKSLTMWFVIKIRRCMEGHYSIALSCTRTTIDVTTLIALFEARRRDSVLTEWPTTTVMPHGQEPRD